MMPSAFDTPFDTPPKPLVAKSADLGGFDTPAGAFVTGGPACGHSRHDLDMAFLQIRRPDAPMS